MECHLKEIMAHKRISVTSLSEQAGLSRTTITALRGGYAKGVTFEVMNKLCTTLNITPNHLFTVKNQRKI